MPLDLVELDMGKRILAPGDRGFLIGAKPRYQKKVVSHAMKWLRRYTQRYFEARCPEEAAAAKEADELAAKEAAETKEETTNGDEVEEAKEVKEETMEEGKEAAAEEKEAEEENAGANHSGILFAERSLVYDSCCFIASNLEDPGDFLHFVFYTMAEGHTTEPRTKFPLRVMPVSTVCESRAKAVETVTLPLMEKVFGQSEDPIRFSISYRPKADGEYLALKDAGNIVRNCIWSVNPNCVQCIKYQDYAVMLEILDPVFLIGVAKDYNKLGGFNTAGVRHGLDTRDEHTDSEDDISDDPNLDEEENKRMILRIKRKRRAEKAGLTQYNGNVKKNQEGEEDEEGNEDGHGEEEDDDEEEEDENGEEENE